MESPRHSCLKLELPNPTEPDKIEPIFIKATWYDTHFDLSITNDPDSWVCKASEEEVRERAAQWDQPVADYIEFAEKRTKLEWQCKCQPSPNPQLTKSGILDFLVDANIRLSFLSVLNSKKGKLREQLVKSAGNGGKSPEEDEESTEKTDPFDERSDTEVGTIKSGTGMSKDVQKGNPRGRKWIALK
ncbi:hypothetical protein CDL15_Pgr016362 [Punica granatum]|uniref:XRCC4 N-terminal domain-containing protein n=1 Tax=Punica granatum TaxID=22663 RepID=A0A218W7T3_PUNGR|nr:hypothetical protein CDL15_Pgr016362 [Punica granatum]